MVAASPSAVPAGIISVPGAASFAEIAQSLLMFIALETPRVNQWAKWAEQVRAEGETPALNVEELREALGHLGEAQRWFAANGSIEQTIRAFCADTSSGVQQK